MKLVFATNNLNKLKEVQAIMPQNITLISLADIGCEEDIPETQNTISGNAVQKANYISQKYGYNCFADDTGLEVEALNGAPGVYSARYAGPERNTENNTNLLLKNLVNATNRNAQFKTVIALCLKSETHTFTGICKGQITEQKRGAKGFGYDPVFMPEHHDVTFAEMDLALKNVIGHRGKAMQKLVLFLENLS